MISNFSWGVLSAIRPFGFPRLIRSICSYNFSIHLSTLLWPVLGDFASIYEINPSGSRMHPDLQWRLNWTFRALLSHMSSSACALNIHPLRIRFKSQWRTFIFRHTHTVSVQCGHYVASFIFIFNGMKNGTNRAHKESRIEEQKHNYEWMMARCEVNADGEKKSSRRKVVSIFCLLLLFAVALIQLDCPVHTLQDSFHFHHRSLNYTHQFHAIQGVQDVLTVGKNWARVRKNETNIVYSYTFYVYFKNDDATHITARRSPRSVSTFFLSSSSHNARVFWWFYFHSPFVPSSWLDRSSSSANRHFFSSFACERVRCVLATHVSCVGTTRLRGPTICRCFSIKWSTSAESAKYLTDNNTAFTLSTDTDLPHFRS